MIVNRDGQPAGQEQVDEQRGSTGAGSKLQDVFREPGQNAENEGSTGPVCVGKNAELRQGRPRFAICSNGRIIALPEAQAFWRGLCPSLPMFFAGLSVVSLHLSPG